MSDSHDHHDDVGAHEVDRMPNGRLFALMLGLSALTLLACVGVVQMFNLQVDSIQSDRADKGAHSQREYLDEHDAIREGFGRVTIKEEDASEGVRYYVPVSKARKQLLDNPALLEGAKPTPVFNKSAVATQIKDWGGMPKAAPKPGADPKKPPRGAIKRPPTKKPAVKKVDGPKPADGKPAGDKPGAKPTGDKPGAKPAGDKPGAKPAGDKPGAKPAGAKPAGAKPAGNKPAGAKPGEGKAN